VVSFDEYSTSTTLLDQFRIWDVWGAYMAGAGGCEFFQTGDATFDDFRSKQSFYATVALARRFIEENVPFWQMDPADALTSGADAYALALQGLSYLVYVPSGGMVSLNLTSVGGSFDVRWFDPRNGGPLQTGDVNRIPGGTIAALGSPPNSTSSDWVALVTTTRPSTPGPPNPPSHRVFFPRRPKHFELSE
jgi:hypothetical protein